MGYHRAPGMSSSFISLSHFLYRNPEDPAKTACLCWQPFNNTVVVVSPRIFCHLALRCAKLNWEKTKPLYDSFHVQIFFFSPWYWNVSLSNAWSREKSLPLSVLKPLSTGTKLELCPFHFLLLLSAQSIPVWENTRNTTHSLDTSTSHLWVLWRPYRNHPSTNYSTVMSPEEISIFVTWAQNGW